MGHISNKPIILYPKHYTENDIDNFKKTHNIWQEVDIFHEQVKELLELRYPNSPKRAKYEERILKEYTDNNSAWVYYPWSGILLHCLGKEELFELRTNRNRNLVSKEEQTKLREITIGVAGMSVGASIAIGAVQGGMSSTIKLADLDHIVTTNLNRVRESLHNVGQSKVQLIAQHIYELDPFTNVNLYEKGINKSNIDNFFTEPKVDIVVDEIDDFKMKVQLRLHAKKQGIPLLMFTSLGDNILIDVERYDLEPELQIFNGLLGSLSDEIINKPEITKDDEKRYAVQLVGQEYIPTRALASLLETGHTLVGRPQLYSTIAVDGGLAVYVIRQIILSGKPVSGRYFIKFADLFDIVNTDLSKTNERIEILKKLFS